MIENKADEMLYYIDIMYVNNNYISANSEMGFCFSSSGIQSDLSVICLSATDNLKMFRELISMWAYRLRAYINIYL